MVQVSTESKLEEKQAWYSASELENFDLTPALRSWLEESGLLTQRLRERSRRAFDVQLINQYEMSLPASARDCLSTVDLDGLIRRVHLVCDGAPHVYAETVIPVTTLRDNPWLAQLGEKSLGESLLARGDVQRSEFAYSRIGAGEPLYRRAVADAGLGYVTEFLWARRSVFSISAHRQLLVNEVFFPTISLL